jgi:hypothetical protein
MAWQNVFAFDTAFLGAIANRIVNEVKGVNRVAYDVMSEPRGRLSGSSLNGRFKIAWTKRFCLS